MTRRARKNGFEQSDAFDAEVRERFGALTHRARDGKLETWSETPRGCLALIILIDQFSRNIHRGSSADMVSGRARAWPLTRLALDRGYDDELNHEERKFLYMPLMHSEGLADQDRSVALFQKLAADGAENGEMTVDYAIRHRDIVAAYGRFPHRNEILGRESTAEGDRVAQGPERVVLASSVTGGGRRRTNLGVPGSP